MSTRKEYLRRVMGGYFRDQGGEDLSILLREPNTSKLKRATLFLLKEKRFTPTDIVNLNHFLNFGNQGSAIKKEIDQDLEQAIEDYQGFKRIVQFIKRYEKDAERNTDDINLEFIAWLTNFKPRPFLNFKNATASKPKDDAKALKDEFLSEKELHLKNHLHFNQNILNDMMENFLNDLLEDYNLQNNKSFANYRNKIDNDVAMQKITIEKLQSKVNALQSKLKKARTIRRYLGGFGLFFMSIDYREPSLENTFDDLLDEYEGLDEDFWDDLI